MFGGRHMSSEQKLRTIWKSPRFWLLVVVVFAIPLLADFNTRLAYVRQMTAEAAGLTQQINQEKILRTELLALRDYVQSSDFVEHWARQAGLARPGETVIKPSPVESAPAITHTVNLPTPVPNDPRHEWAALFFGPQ
jgi:hypothetical protein